MPFPRAAAALLILMTPGFVQAGLFSRHAIGVADIYGGPRPMTVSAPDGRTRAIARFSDWAPDDHSKDRLSVFIGGDDHDFPGGAKTELLWAPDSRALAVTANSADADGGFETSILVRKPKGRHWREIDLTDTITALFASRMHCEDDAEIPDIGAVGWTSGQRLIVAAQVPAKAGCANVGAFMAYIVDVPSGDVLMQVTPASLRQRYRHMLGAALVASAGRHRHRSR